MFIWLGNGRGGFWMISLFLSFFLCMGTRSLRGLFPLLILFAVIFFVAPLIRSAWQGQHAGGNGEYMKRKNEDVVQGKLKNDEIESSDRYIRTESGDVIEIIDEPDRARRPPEDPFV